jgi:hypothetical protein
MDVVAIYQERLQHLEAGLSALQQKQWIAAAILAGSLIMALMLGLAATRKWQFIAPLSLAIASARTYGQRGLARLRLSRLHAFYSRGVKRLDGDWAGSGEAGEEFVDPGHVYARDLNLFGAGSLFERLCPGKFRILSARPPDRLRQFDKACELWRQVYSLSPDYFQLVWSAASCSSRFPECRWRGAECGWIG